jgi:SAM-dependent methyltransferase
VPSGQTGMHPKLTEIARYLCCPDDRASLAVATDHLRCERCTRVFEFRPPNLLEMLPSSPVAISDAGLPREYSDAYRQGYVLGSRAANDELPFGAAESLPEKRVRSRTRQVEEVLRLFGRDNGEDGGIFCDLSAGAGNATFAAARTSRLVFHCDLSVASVRYASHKAMQTGLDNIVVVRADYFQPPFRRSIERLTCLDTLIRGPWHDVRLLKTIRRVLAPGGVAVVDFHNWWHNPLRRMGLLRENFGENRSYTRREVVRLLAQAGIDQFTIGGFFQEVDLQRAVGQMLQPIVPATRFVVRFGPGDRLVADGEDWTGGRMQ